MRVYKNLSFLLFIAIFSFSCKSSDKKVEDVNPPIYENGGSDFGDGNNNGIITTPSVDYTTLSLKTENFHKVNDCIYRSARPDNDDMSKLNQLGIRYILSLENESETSRVITKEKEAANQHGINLLQVRMNGLLKPKVEDINRAVEILNNSSYQPILVHCKHGSDRTGIVMAAYRIKVDGWSADQAKNELNEDQYGHSTWLKWWDSVLEQL